MIDIREFIKEIVKDIEGGYTNDPDDSGGETNHGITIAVARAYGYEGDMKDLSVDMALDILVERYWKVPRFDKIQPICEIVAMELLDTGINMHPSVAATFLQRALNVLNNGAKLFPDITADGNIGPMTIAALKAFIAARGDNGIKVLFNMLNSQQSMRYIELAERRPKDEKYEFGWQLNRVVML